MLDPAPAAGQDDGARGPACDPVRTYEVRVVEGEVYVKVLQGPGTQGPGTR